MLWRMSAGLHDERIGIMGAAQPFSAHPQPATRVSASSVLPPPPMAQMGSANCDNCANRLAAISAPPPGSVDRAGALVAVGPAHVGRQGEGDLAVVVARRGAELERL